MTEQKKQWYALQLEDYARPAFSSATKWYYGTLEEIRDLMKYLAHSKNRRKSHKDTLRAFQEFCAGKEDATHDAAYGKRLLMKRVTCIAETELELKDYIWEHLNIWRWPCPLKASHILVKQCIIWDGERYIRCIKPTFAELCDESIREKGKWDSMHGIGFWGFPGMLREKETVHSCSLYIEEMFYDKESNRRKIKRYKTAEEAIQDIGDAETVSFLSVCDEIFGDG